MSQSDEKILQERAERLGGSYETGDVYLTFAELKRRGIVGNRTTLARWIATLGFPPGVMIGPNSRRWKSSSVEIWLQQRATQAAEAERAA